MLLAIKRIIFLRLPSEDGINQTFLALAVSTNTGFLANSGWIVLIWPNIYIYVHTCTNYVDFNVFFIKKIDIS